MGRSRRILFSQVLEDIKEEWEKLRGSREGDDTLEIKNVSETFLLSTSMKLAKPQENKSMTLMLYFHLCPFLIRVSIIIIIIIGKTSLFKPQRSLQDSARLLPVFTSLDFATVILLTEQNRQPCV
jgi:hypothetical protein